ncbi:NuoI/complex I 23 kDa subunit family protein [Hyperthermus butylicus]|uniref:NADH-ubiquinone oxidoreductase subunit 8 n=1 Tax=Hyperthermus butylicus (strain DSM 5456 / JCM 9403 / PLM1-5) TaxID=415426 RepID=A2BJ98_HYPBU|nr:NADH-quinone oxidoreductase subunit I [Hyperthermus butylicus]ABM80059.1 NADH-ubiquinone oxidoreductase subunit 8 [Hyperthermus butylicus DSM 5456]
MSQSGQPGAGQTASSGVRVRRVSRPKAGIVSGHVSAISAALRRASKKPMTLMYPTVEEEKPQLFRGFILYDYDKCIGCSLCAQICPARAIKMYRVPGDKRLRPGYDVGRCIYCGLCTDICPTDALILSDRFDHVFEKLEDMIFDPIDWAQISKKIREEKPTRKRVRTLVDEEVGLRYEPIG